MFTSYKINKSINKINRYYSLTSDSVVKDVVKISYRSTSTPLTCARERNPTKYDNDHQHGTWAIIVQRQLFQ